MDGAQLVVWQSSSISRCPRTLWSWKAGSTVLGKASNSGLQHNVGCIQLRNSSRQAAGHAWHKSQPQRGIVPCDRTFLLTSGTGDVESCNANWVCSVSAPSYSRSCSPLITVPSRESLGLGMRVMPLASSTYVRGSNSLVSCRRCGFPALTSSLQTQKGPPQRSALPITSTPTADDERSKDGRDAGRGVKARLLTPYGGLSLGRNHSQIGRFTGCR